MRELCLEVATTRLMMIATMMQEHGMLTPRQEQTAVNQHVQENKAQVEKPAVGLMLIAGQSILETAARRFAILLPIPARHEWQLILRQCAKGLCRILNAQLRQRGHAGRIQVFQIRHIPVICGLSIKDALLLHHAVQKTGGTAPAIPQPFSVL